MKKILLAGMALTLLALACNEPVATEEDYRIVPTSPAYVLNNVMVAFNRRDIGLLKAMLGENFVFYFDPDDVGQSPPGSHYIIPESWSYAEFWLAVRNLFQKAYAISLTIPTGNVGKPDPNATTYRAENINIKILVMIDEQNGFLVDHGYCNFEFEKYRSQGGAYYWRLTKWWDNTATQYDGNASVTPASFGRILASYY